MIFRLHNCVCVFFFLECYFIFRSSRQKVGNIQSPNYPGLYPRMIDCYYVFYGVDKEIVVISFENFDVEGLPT